MFKSITLRSVMSIALFALVIASTMPAANACDSKNNRQTKIVRPLSAIVKGIKHLLGGNGDSQKREPSVDDDFVTDYSEFPISG
jgi:hypothetical protein